MLEEDEEAGAARTLDASGLKQLTNELRRRAFKRRSQLSGHLVRLRWQPLFVLHTIVTLVALSFLLPVDWTGTRFDFLLFFLLFCAPVCSHRFPHVRLHQARRGRQVHLRTRQSSRVFVERPDAICLFLCSLLLHLLFFHFFFFFFFFYIILLFHFLFLCCLLV